MFKANLFKLNRNKRYNYTPRYYQGKTIENRNRSNRSFNPTLLVAIAVLTFIFLFIIDFDLSIFST